MTFAPLLAFATRPLPPPSLALRGVVNVDRARVACLLTSAFRSAGSAHVRALHAAAIESARALSALSAPDDAELEARRATAVALRDRVAELPEPLRTPVLVAVVRDLLADAPACCLPLDRAVRDAARHHAHAVTAEHERIAADVLREVGL